MAHCHLDVPRGKGEVDDADVDAPVYQTDQRILEKFENHAYMVAIHTVWYTWVRIQKSMRLAPAMEAKLTDRVWSLIALIEMTDEVAQAGASVKLRHYHMPARRLL